MKNVFVALWGKSHVIRKIKAKDLIPEALIDIN